MAMVSHAKPRLIAAVRSIRFPRIRQRKMRAFIGFDITTTLPELKSIQKVSNLPDYPPAVEIQSHRETRYEHVRAVMAALSSAGITRIKIGAIYEPPRTNAQAIAYIPKDLNDCHAQILKECPPAMIDSIKAMTNEDDMATFHFGMGLGIRNEWGLWQGSRLSKYFNDLGVQHPDDMSGIILGTLWCRIHNQPFRLEERVKDCQVYWRANAAPPETSTTPDGAKIDFRQSWTGVESNGIPHAVHIGQSKKDGSFWVYEWDKGVYAPTGQMLKTIVADDYWKKRLPNKRRRPVVRKSYFNVDE